MVYVLICEFTRDTPVRKEAACWIPSLNDIHGAKFFVWHCPNKEFAFWRDTGSPKVLVYLDALIDSGEIKFITKCSFGRCSGVGPMTFKVPIWLSGVEFLARRVPLIDFHILISLSFKGLLGLIIQPLVSSSQGSLTMAS